MRFKLACASLLVLSGCAADKDALAALQQMQILENSPDAPVSYEKLSGWGHDLTLTGVEVRAPARHELVAVTPDPAAPPKPPKPASAAPGDDVTTVLRAESVTFKGLTLKNGKPFARDIVASNLAPATKQDDTFTLAIDTIALEGMNDTTGAYIARAFGKDGPGAPPDLAQWAFDKAAINGIAFSLSIPQEEADPGSVNIKLGELSFSGMKESNIAAVRLSGLAGDLNIPSVPAVVGNFDFGTMDIRNFRAGLMAGIVGASLQSALNPSEPVDYVAAYKDFTSPIDTYFDSADWTGFAMNLSGLKFDISPVHSNVTRDAAGVAVAAHGDRATLTLKADSNGGTLGAMGMMMLAMTGYDSDTVQMYVQGDASFDPANDITHWDNINVGVTDAFDVKLSLGIKGLKQAMPTLLAAVGQLERSEGFADMFGSDDDAGDHEDFDEDEDGDVEEDNESHDDADQADEDGGDEHSEDEDGPEASPFDNGAMVALMMGLLPLQLTDLDVSITDQKVIDLILDQQALKGGVTAAELRADIAAMVSDGASALADAGIDKAIADELTAAVAGFLSGPGTLHIQLKPKTPFGAMTAMLQPITKDSLGFSASFTPAPAAPAAN